MLPSPLFHLARYDWDTQMLYFAAMVPILIHGDRIYANAAAEAGRKLVASQLSPSSGRLSLVPLKQTYDREAGGMLAQNLWQST
jgi:hypothetical protein